MLRGLREKQPETGRKGRGSGSDFETLEDSAARVPDKWQQDVLQVVAYLLALMALVEMSMMGAQL
jgi:hypothetical protein